jgi:hypothetical protein
MLFDPKAKEKADVLDDGAYVFDYIHLMYVHKAHKAAFSHLFLDAHTPEEIKAFIEGVTPKDEWQFFTLKPLHPSVRQKLEARYARAAAKRAAG